MTLAVFARLSDNGWRFLNFVAGADSYINARTHVHTVVYFPFS